MEKNPSQSTYSYFYSRINDDLVSTSDRLIRSKLKWIPYSSDTKILDVACGVSRLSQTFGKKVYGIEMNRKAVIAANNNGIRAKLGDVEQKWDYPDKYFDLVYANHIIEHLRNPDHLITEAKRVLKQNGLLIIGTPNLAAWFNRVLLFFGIQPFFTEVSTVDKSLGLGFTRHLTAWRKPMGHLRIFTTGSLYDLLDLYGFKPIASYGIEFLSFPKSFRYIDKLISNHSVSLASNIMVVAQKKHS